MAGRRRNPSVRGNRRRTPIPALDTTIRSRGTAYEDIVLGQAARAAATRRVSRQIDAGGAAPAQAEAEGNFSPRMRMAMDLAREGDDTLLMPYQPTPSINKARPRTRAIGYDPKTQTMWIKFRESKKNPNGAVYEYYNVPYRHWKNVKRVQSPGKWMNRNLIDKYPYARTDL